MLYLHPYTKSMFLFRLYTGCRSQDLFGLKLSDLKDAVEKPDEKCICLKKKKNKIPRYYYFCEQIAEPLRECLTELENSPRIKSDGMIWGTEAD